MNYEEIITFLQVVEDGSIASAAEKLFISQGGASLRIKQLEKKLDSQLFERGPGIRNVQLTNEGKNLLPIAQQIQSLWSDALSVNVMSYYRPFNIGSLDSINLFYFENVYLKFSNTFPNIFLTISTYHSSQIHELIENQTHDLGFVFGLYEFPNVVSFPLFTESMVVICHKNNPFTTSLDLNDLDVSEEIHVKWSTEFEIWHTQNFPFSKRKRITVGTAMMIPSFLNRETSWVIAPKTMAKKICVDIEDYIYINPENTKIPQRTGYALFHKYLKPEKKRYIADFLAIISEELKYIDTIELLEYKL